MGILRSFNTGVSGLQANGQALAVVGDNIANASTTGFKSSRPEFQDMLATSLKGIDGGDQMGAGTKVAHIAQQFTQGTVQRTENITDLAVSGNGFFVIDAPFGKAFTRDGQFHFDKDGFLINGDGYKVQGFQADGEGKITNKTDPIKLGGTTIPASATENVSMNMNLDSRAEIKQFDPLRPDKTSNYNSSITIYDNVGTARVVTLYFNKTANNNWTYRAMVDGADVEGGVEGQMYEQYNGTLAFNDKGQLQVEQGAGGFNFNKGAAPNQQVKFDFGQSITEGGNGSDASTQYGSDSTIARHTQDGSSAASLSSLSFNDDGVLSASYNNGETRDIAQIVIAKFENNEGLFKKGKNLFKESRKSGQGAYGKPGEAGRGEVYSKSVELSNVDLASEFVNLMTQQRNFSANTRTITTSDQMLQEVLNIKR